MEKVITIFRGKQIREMAERLTAGTFRIEKETLNRYAVYDSVETPDQAPAMYLNRIGFVRFDAEIYKIQARKNPLAFAIERSLDNDALEFCIDKASVDKMPVKLIARTFSSAKVTLESITVNQTGNCYLLTISIVKSVSERDLTEKEQDIASMFQRANAAAGNQVTPETPALPAPETSSASVDTTATEIPAK